MDIARYDEVVREANRLPQTICKGVKRRMKFSPNILLDLVSLATVLIVFHGERKRKPNDVIPSSRFRALLSCISLILAFDLLGWLADGASFPGVRVLLYLTNTGYYAFQIVYCWLWLFFVHEWTRSSGKKANRLWRVLSALPMAGELVILAANPFTGWIFTLDRHNVYTRGAGYVLNLAPYLLYILAALGVIFRACALSPDEETRRHNTALCIYMMLPVFGAIMEAFNYGTPWTWPLMALSLLLVYVGVLDNQASKDRVNAARLEVELAENRRAIMLSQIQPHFLYNALCVIQDLCHGKAPEAEKATLAFSRFLRGNMESLTTTGCIPFEQELSHTKYYLDLEKTRFGSRLNVNCHVACELFRLPPLTLQPIVENAVRNGICKREEGGTVSISTWETASDYWIRVEDDGVGFDPGQPRENGRTGIGIQNVKERLAQVGGVLEICSTPNVGTVATIAIPKEGGPL